MYLSKLSLEGKVAIVAGGGRGMGEAISHALGEAGAKLLVADYNESRATAVANQVVKDGGTANPYRVDLRDAGMVDDMTSAAVAKYGPIDVLVNVAGGMSRYPWVPTSEWTDDAWDGVMALNLRYVFLTCRAVINSMLEHDHPGNIVSIASVSGLDSSPNHSAYGAGKAGLMQFTKTLAWEYGPQGVRVNAIAPGTIRTPLVAAGINEESEEKIPLKRAGETSEIASAVLFLVSDLASYITGQTIVVDGGIKLRFN